MVNSFYNYSKDFLQSVFIVLNMIIIYILITEGESWNVERREIIPRYWWKLLVSQSKNKRNGWHRYTCASFADYKLQSYGGFSVRKIESLY